MPDISISTLDIPEENAVEYFYNLETAKPDYFHVDVMDGEFVSINNVEKQKDYALKINSIAMTPFEVHIMAANPRYFLDFFIDNGADRVIFHAEACKNKDDCLDIIKYLIENGVKVGVAINPDTSFEKLYEVLPYIHMVLVMTVVPGAGGQSFKTELLDKIKDLRAYLDKNDLDIDIEVDGGINKETAKQSVQAGANVLVSGSYILKSDNFKNAINDLKGEE